MLLFISFDPELWWNYLLSCVDFAQSLAIIGINQAELELRHPRKLIARFLNLGSVETRNLDQNPIAADRADNWFATTEVIDALANDLDRLVEYRLGNFFIATFQP